MSITQNCAWPDCARTFEAERADARYCSPTCRSRASKERKRAGGGDEAKVVTGPAEVSTARPVMDGGTGPAAPGFRSSLVERFFDLEDRVDDLEFHGEEEQKKFAGLLGLPALIDAVERRVPSEARIKERARDEILEEIHALGGRVEEMERVALCACLSLDENPDAPDIILPGFGERREEAARLLREQRRVVPVFIKRAIDASSGAPLPGEGASRWTPTPCSLLQHGHEAHPQRP